MHRKVGPFPQLAREGTLAHPAITLETGVDPGLEMDVSPEITPQQMFASARYSAQALQRLSNETKVFVPGFELNGVLGSAKAGNKMIVKTMISHDRGCNLIHRLDVLGTDAYRWGAPGIDIQNRAFQETLRARVSMISELIHVEQSNPSSDLDVILEVPLDGSITEDEYVRIYQNLTTTLAELLSNSPTDIAKQLVVDPERWNQLEEHANRALEKNDLYEAVSSDRVLAQVEEIITSEYPDTMINDLSLDADMAGVLARSNQNWRRLVKENLLNAIFLMKDVTMTSAEYEEYLYKIVHGVNDQLRAKVVGKHMLGMVGALESFMANEKLDSSRSQLTYPEVIFPEGFSEGQRVIFTQLGGMNRWLTPESIWVEFDARATRSQTAYVDGDSGDTNFDLDYILDHVLDLSKALIISAIRSRLGGADIVEGQTIGGVDFKAQNIAYEIHIGSDAFKGKPLDYWEQIAAEAAQKGIKIVTNTIQSEESIDLSVAIATA